jgi:hypothetical protein
VILRQLKIVADAMGVYRESTASQPTAGQSAFGLRVQTRFVLVTMLGYHFHRLTPVLRPKQSGFSWNTGAYRFAKEINMTVQEQIEQYIATQPEPKQSEMRELHDMMLALIPACQLWFLDGKDEKGKIVSNPSIGYGSRNIQYANGKTREFYQIGMSANTTGITVYIFGIDDKKHLAQTFGRDLGKASVTGYCIKFKTLADIKVAVLKAAIQSGIGQTGISH